MLSHTTRKIYSKDMCEFSECVLVCHLVYRLATYGMLQSQHSDLGSTDTCTAWIDRSHFWGRTAKDYQQSLCSKTGKHQVIRDSTLNPTGSRSFWAQEVLSERPCKPDSTSPYHIPVALHPPEKPEHPQAAAPVEKTRTHSKNNPVTVKMRHAGCTMGGVAGLEDPLLHT